MIKEPAQQRDIIVAYLYVGQRKHVLLELFQNVSRRANIKTAILPV